MAISYRDSGVDVERGYKAVELMKRHVKTTFDANVLGDIGSFGGFYSIAGEKKGETEVKDGNYYMQERSFGTFNRSLALPDNIEINKITSSLKNGVLTINIPKTEEKEIKTVKIPVK